MSEDRQGLFVPLPADVVRVLDALAVASNKPDAASVVKELVEQHLFGRLHVIGVRRKADE